MCATDRFGANEYRRAETGHRLWHDVNMPNGQRGVSGETGLPFAGLKVSRAPQQPIHSFFLNEVTMSLPQEMEIILGELVGSSSTAKVSFSLTHCGAKTPLSRLLSRLKPSRDVQLICLMM